MKHLEQGFRFFYFSLNISVYTYLLFTRVITCFFCDSAQLRTAFFYICFDVVVAARLFKRVLTCSLF